MKRVAASYERPLVEASRSALLELALSLRTYRGALVLQGGWVLHFLFWNRQAAQAYVTIFCTCLRRLFTSFYGVHHPSS